MEGSKDLGIEEARLVKAVFVVGLLFLVFGAILTRGHELQEREQALEKGQAFTIYGKGASSDWSKLREVNRAV
ncbi:MAG: hypothetical protein WBP34_17445 [Thermoanaerobaculia bacterium]